MTLNDPREVEALLQAVLVSHWVFGHSAEQIVEESGRPDLAEFIDLIVDTADSIESLPVA